MKSAVVHPACVENRIQASLNSPALNGIRQVEVCRWQDAQEDHQAGVIYIIT